MSAAETTEARTSALQTEILTPEERDFALIQRKASAFASSPLVPKEYQGNTANCMIAMELAERTSSSTFMVMQNVHIIHGKPSWSSQFIIGALNSCGRFSPLRFVKTGEIGSMARTYVAVATDLASGCEVEGPPVSLQMAKDEGWSTKNGSKWKTMPELMLSYRSAAFFGRLYAPDVLMGMHTADELQDISGSVEPSSAAAIESLRDVTPQKPEDAGEGAEDADFADEPEFDLGGEK